MNDEPTGPERNGLTERGLGAEMLACALVKSLLEHPVLVAGPPSSKTTRLLMGAVQPIQELQWAPDVDPENDPRVMVATDIATTLGVMAEFVANSLRNLSANGVDISQAIEQMWTPYDLDEPDAEANP